MAITNWKTIHGAMPDESPEECESASVAKQIGNSGYLLSESVDFLSRNLGEHMDESADAVCSKLDSLYNILNLPKAYFGTEAIANELSELNGRIQLLSDEELHELNETIKRLAQRKPSKTVNITGEQVTVNFTQD